MCLSKYDAYLKSMAKICCKVYVKVVIIAFLDLQYRYLTPAPVNQMSASVCSYKHPWITGQRISQQHHYMYVSWS